MAEEHNNVHYQEQHQQLPTELLQLRDSLALQPIDLSSLRLNPPAAASGGCQFYYHHHHPNQPCSAGAATSGSNNSMKRRSPDTSSAERRAKKHFLDRDSLALQGFSSVSLPMSLASLTGSSSRGRPVLRRCVSDPTKPPTSAEGVAGGSPATATGNGLPPLPPSLRRTVSDVTPSPPKILSRSLSSEETTTPVSSMKVQKMKERFKEVLQLCHEALESEEEEEEEEGGGREEERKEEEEKEEEGKVRGYEELGECVVADYDNNNEVPTQDNDNLKGEEEAVSVEWADKCLRVMFRCPCGKGYEVLLSENTCYYKLV
ncbi:hypothetical protein PIB30_042846 [Stylosanthes scabra]|uniref:Uncharacterized protein n=1 Tax=Stylosanthes scabra TaxID=79078 RepID=A0ABU6XH26_9FABA|nr:hypothetical protein [Stylosanthes scabra]